MEFDVIYGGTHEELYAQARQKVEEGWNLQGDPGIAHSPQKAGDVDFIYYYQVISKLDEPDWEAGRDRLLELAKNLGFE